MSQREARRSRQIMEALRFEGYFCFKVHGSEYMMTGLPDIIVCAEGLFIGIETKNPETREDTSPAQKLVHTKINNAGGVARVATSAKEALAIVKGVIDEHNSRS